MILCLDIGNSHIFGGVFEGERLRLTFRKSSRAGVSSDEYGLFFRGVLRENDIEPASISNVALCSVVPELVYSISAGCQKYFDKQPFILKAGTRTGLKIRYRNPLEVGADRIANAIAAAGLNPDRNVLIVDLGTATTVDVLSAEREYLGGAIMPGLRLSMQALDRGAARLGSVEILRPAHCLGKSTAGSIQAGLYFSHLGALRELVARLATEAFSGERPKIIATGGFAGLFENEDLFDEIVTDLVLRGLLMSLLMNLE